MTPAKTTKTMALFLVSILVFGNFISASAQASTIKKIVTKKAGRIATPGINTLLSGAGAPKSTIGIDGDIYIDTKNTNMHGPKTLGKWPAGISLKGAAGTNGTNGINGSTGASGAAGAKGAPSSGTEGVSGSPGPAGPAGPAGATGTTGPAGSGAAGANGTPGINGSPGSNGSNGTAGSVGTTGATGSKGETGTAGPAGSGNVIVINLTSAGGGINWGLSSASPAEISSSPFGNLQPNTKYRFTIIVNGSANKLGFSTLPVGSVVTLTGTGATLNYSSHYGIGTVSDSAYTKTFNFSYLHEGTVTVADSVSSLTVSVIDGSGWSAGMNSNALEITAKAFIQVA